MKEIGYLAFYTPPKKMKLYERLVQILDRSQYTHVEIAVYNDNATFTSYSSAASRGGVSKRTLNFDSSYWTLMPIEVDREKLESIYIEEMGCKYDFIGLLSTKITWFGHSKSKWFCSELCAYMLNIPGKPHNFGINSLYRYAARYLTN